MTTVVQRQYLRVKRPLSAVAPSTLRLEGLQPTSHCSSAAVALSNLSIASSNPENNNATQRHENETPSRKRPTSALLKRVADAGQEIRSSAASGPTTTSYRIIDAVLAKDDDNHADHNNLDATKEASGNKRRRLTLVASKTITDHQSLEQIFQQTSQGGSDTAKRKKKKKPLRVLDPLERIVDESLKKVYQGELTPRQHYSFVVQNDALRGQRRHWLAWNNVEMGNLLHACALWNDAELAADLLKHGTDDDRSRLGNQLDGEGRTPFQIAQMTDHDSVVQVLESFGADVSNYVYDLYCLDTTMIADDDNHPFPENNHDGDDAPLNNSKTNGWYCDLQGGYGYWDEEGRLMLEAINNHLLEHDAADANGAGNNDDEEEDSNDEGFVGNDYPDEDAYQNYWEEADSSYSAAGDNDNDSSDDDDLDVGRQRDSTFRKAPADLGGDDFDAAFGIYGQE